MGEAGGVRAVVLKTRQRGLLLAQGAMVSNALLIPGMRCAIQFNSRKMVAG